MVGLIAACALVLFGVAQKKPQHAMGEANMRGVVGLSADCDDVCKKDDRKERPICKEERRLEDTEAVQKLEDFFEGSGAPGPAPAHTAFSPAVQAQEDMLDTFSRQPVDQSDGTAVTDFITAKAQDCISVRPVLTISTPFALTAMGQELPTEFYLPMLLRAYTRSIVESMDVNDKTVSVRIVDGSRRLSSHWSTNEDSIPSHVKANFKVVAEVTDPMSFLIQSIESPDFEGKFREMVKNKINAEGAANGIGTFHEIATFEKPEIVETDTNTLEGDVTSLGYGTVCRKDASDTSNTGEGHTEVRITHSMRHCSQICKTYGEGCHGFEYEHASGRCELWKVAICDVEAAPAQMQGTAFECFKKC